MIEFIFEIYLILKNIFQDDDYILNNYKFSFDELKIIILLMNWNMINFKKLNDNFSHKQNIWIQNIY